MTPLLALAVGTYLGPRITPNDVFFQVSIRGPQHLDKGDWALDVTGLVANPITLKYEDILAMPNVSIEARVLCVSGPSGNAVWKGVPLSYVLSLANPSASAVEAVFTGADGYTSSMTLGEIANGSFILAYGMNGETLPPAQGFPLRVAAPGNYGYKWVMWLVEIKLVDYDYKGYWESRGWSDDARRVDLSDWLPHAVLLSVGFVFYGLSIASGYSDRQGRLSKILVPGMGRRFHMAASAAAGGILLVTFAYWAQTTLDRRGALFYTGHGVMAALLLGLFAASAISAVLVKRRGWATSIHEYTSLFSFVLYGGVLGTGLLMSGLL
jgi:hypothetical protein